jgi:CBS domain containing-hemolysin-like protein
VTAFLIVCALIALNGLFVAAEFAIIGAPRAAIDARAAKGQRLAIAVQAILRDPRRQDRYIATAQLGITLASLGLGMYGEHALAGWIYERLGGLGGPAWLASHALASTVAIAIFTYFHIVIGEMVPKSIALQYAERSVLWITPIMMWIRNVLFPLVFLLNGIGTLLLKMIGVARQQQSADHFYTAEELELVVRESEQLGVLRGEAGQMLREIFEFGDLTAGQVMVPRVRLVGIEVGTGPAEVRDLLAQSPFTRYPIYEEDLDHILGGIHIKEVFRLVLHGVTVGPEHARPLPVVPETAPLDVVLSTLRAERTQMAIVIDEHGGTAGVVTLEDLFEEVVGEIDEGPTTAPEIYRDTQGRLHVPGTMRVDELGQQFDLDLEHEEVDSISGLVLMLLGRPPVVGDTVRYDRLSFEVTAVMGHGVEECAVWLSA